MLKLHKITYGQKNVDRVWNDYLVEKLIKIWFEKYHGIKCVFYKGRIIYALCTYDFILSGPCPKDINKIIV